MLKTFAGAEVDRRPYTFWYPFGLNHMKGESLVAATLSFAASYGVDLVRLPLVRDLPLKEQTSLDRPHDLTQIEVLSGHAGFWLERAEALKLARKMSDKKVALFETIPEPWTALSYLCRRELLKTTESSHPSFLEKALETVTESLKNYLNIILKGDIVDGLVVEIESATYEQREPDQFKAHIKPHLQALLAHVAAEAGCPVWLQVRGSRIYLEPLLDLPHGMLSWPHLSAGPKLENALPKRHKGLVAGGLDEKALADMSYQDIRHHVEEARNMFVSMLTVGDQLPSDLSPSRLAALASFLSKRDRAPGKEATRPSADR